ncbi:MAG TPA: hypothetical protein VF796_22085 [Humisphaera sp.]
MGSHYFSRMARTPPYKRVVALLGDGAGRPGASDVDPGSLEQVADATMAASVDGLAMAKADLGLAYCFYLLAQIPRTAAGQGDDFAAGLERVGLSPPRRALGLPDAVVRAGDAGTTRYTVFALAAGFVASVDRRLREERARTDIGELGQLAATESLCALSLDEAQTLFGSTEESVRRSLARLSTDRGFGALAHDFFARLVRRYLEYHLSRELSNHVGPGRRFASADEHNEFLVALDRHCRVATSVLVDFAVGWYGLHDFRDDITPEKAGGFVAHALDLVRGALVYQEGRDVQ